MKKPDFLNNEYKKAIKDLEDDKSLTYFFVAFLIGIIIIVTIDSSIHKAELAKVKKELLILKSK